MKLYILSKNAKYLEYWSLILKDTLVFDPTSKPDQESILIVDKDSYRSSFTQNIDKIIVLDAEPNFETCLKLMQEGVKAYGNIYMHTSHILSAIESVQEGKVWMYPDFVSALINSVKPLTPIDITYKITSLTHREVEITDLILDGLTNKEIASKLELSVSTIKNHTQNIYTKLGVHDRLSLFSYLK